MKTNLPVLLSLFLLSLIPSFLFSQSPQSIPYQAVVRNADGTTMSNAALTMIFKIHDITATGTVVYQESHSVTSNAQGLVSCNLGHGTPVIGTFANINWGNGAKFLHVLMNSSNGDLDLGTQQMMSVPYALYAEKTGGSVPTGSAPGELMYWNGQGWTSIPPGGYGQALVMCDGVPTWGGCVPRLGDVQIQSNISSSIPDSINNYLHMLLLRDDILSSGVTGANSNEFTNSGFLISLDSLFTENVFNMPAYLGGYGNFPSNAFYFYGNGGFYLELSSTYFVKAYCTNSVGTGYSNVISFTTIGPNGIITGCSDPNACNYNSDVTVSDNSCLWIGNWCDDNNPNTMNDMITSNCVCEGIQVINGCTNSQACNYSVSANADDGSCLFQGGTCDDGDVNSVNDVLNANCVCSGTLGWIGGLGSQLLPGNTICTNEFISVTGCGGQTSLTYDDRTYDLVEIGGQCWFADNLSTDQYRNGDPIPNGAEINWATTTSGAYSYYYNDPSYDSIYAKQYNWYTTVDSRGLCPSGWHVPSDCEWMYLEGSLGLSIADQQIEDWRGPTIGYALKSTQLWGYSDSQGTWGSNSSGFNAIPNGHRYPNGSFDNVIGGYANWWTSSSGSILQACHRGLQFNIPTISRVSTMDKHWGHSVRCMKD